MLGCLSFSLGGCEKDEEEEEEDRGAKPVWTVGSGTGWTTGKRFSDTETDGGGNIEVDAATYRHTGKMMKQEEKNGGGGSCHEWWNTEPLSQTEKIKKEVCWTQGTRRRGGQLSPLCSSW